MTRNDWLVVIFWLSLWSSLTVLWVVICLAALADRTFKLWFGHKEAFIDKLGREATEKFKGTNVPQQFH